MRQECQRVTRICRICNKAICFRKIQKPKQKTRTSPNTKIGNQETIWILELSRKRTMGTRKIQAELKRLH